MNTPIVDQMLKELIDKGLISKNGRDNVTPLLNSQNKRWNRRKKKK